MSDDLNPPSEPRVDGAGDADDGHRGNGDGRDPNGKFARGNKLGVGNPLAGRAAKLRGILLAKLTPEDMAAIADTLIAMARAGDLPAIRELLDRTLGKPSPLEILERVEALEELHAAAGKGAP